MTEIILRETFASTKSLAHDTRTLYHRMKTMTDKSGTNIHTC